MVSRVTLYGRLQALWFVLVVVGTVVVYAGLARPYVSPTVLPEGPATVGVVFGGAIAGILVFGHLRRRAWLEMGRQMGFAPGSRSLVSSETSSSLPVSVFPLPDLEGSVDGRDVRVTTYKRHRGGGDDGGSTESYTLVEAALCDPVETGLVVGRGSAPADDATADVVSGPVEFTAVDDEFGVVGEVSTDAAREILSGDARTALLDLDNLDGLTIGDPTDVFVGALPDAAGAFLDASGLEAKLRDHPANDASTVSIKTEGVVSDPSRLQRQAAAVAAVAGRVDGVGVEPSPA